MIRGLIVFASAAALAGGAHAGPRPFPFLGATQAKSHAPRTVSFRLVQDPQYDPDPVYHWGVAAQAEVAPNAMLGIGLLRARPKKLSGDWNTDSGASHSRSTKIDFLLRF